MKPLPLPIRWGIVGCGDVCEVKSGPAFQKIEGSFLQAVMRRDAAKAADYATRHGVGQWYDDAKALIHDPAVDAIYVATPPHAHAQYALMAAEAGKPVYVEKPMARTHEECQTMLAACRKAGVPLFVAYYRRRLPQFLKIQELLQSQAIGEVRMANIRLFQSVDPALVRKQQLKNWRVDPQIAGGGYFFDLASHQLDLMDFWFGKIEAVQGLAVNQAALYEAEDLVSASWRHENGVIGSGTWCFTVAENATREEGEIIGSQGSIRFQFFGKPEVILETESGQESFSFAQSPHIQQPLIQSVMDHLTGKGTCPSMGESAARTNWVMDQIVR
jgi:predicted dehydrogenase